MRGRSYFDEPIAPAAGARTESKSLFIKLAYAYRIAADIDDDIISLLRRCPAIIFLPVLRQISFLMPFSFDDWCHTRQPFIFYFVDIYFKWYFLSRAR